MKYEQMCKEILSLVGGRENIIRCFNCMTRLRLILVDPDKADLEALKQVKGVLGVNLISPQLQCIIGQEAARYARNSVRSRGWSRIRQRTNPKAKTQTCRQRKSHFPSRIFPIK